LSKLDFAVGKRQGTDVSQRGAGASKQVGRGVGNGGKERLRGGGIEQADCTIYMQSCAGSVETKAK
jgi:hypothetical protein